jgi:hypothetical protein
MDWRLRMMEAAQGEGEGAVYYSKRRVCEDGRMDCRAGLLLLFFIVGFLSSLLLFLYALSRSYDG